MINREEIIGKLVDDYIVEITGDRDAFKRAMVNLFELFGIFELLETAAKAAEAFTSWKVSHEPDREIYRYQYMCEMMRELDAVIAKVTGTGKEGSGGE